MKLSEKDLVHLMRLLQSYSYKWNPIGLSLGFTQHELNTIFGMLKLLLGAPVSYLQELLNQWVQWPTEEHQNNPTLEALCTALRSSLVGLGSLAEEVEKEMKHYATGKLVSPHSKSELGRVPNFCMLVLCCVLVASHEHKFFNAVQGISLVGQFLTRYCTCTPATTWARPCMCEITV